MRVSTTVLACDFCGKTQHDVEVEHLVIGPEPQKPAICSECVKICVDILAAETDKEPSNG